MSDDHDELPLDPDLPFEPALAAGSLRPLPLHLSPAALGWVSAGGAVGTAGRYAVSLAVPSMASWPLATLAVNIAGAFLLGALLEGLTRRGPDHGRRRRLRLSLGTGFCGGFTTYSALAVEAEQLLRAGNVVIAVGYALITVIVGLLASAGGITVAAGQHRRSS